MATINEFTLDTRDDVSDRREIVCHKRKARDSFSPTQTEAPRKSARTSRRSIDCKGPGNSTTQNVQLSPVAAQAGDHITGIVYNSPAHGLGHRVGKDRSASSHQHLPDQASATAATPETIASTMSQGAEVLAYIESIERAIAYGDKDDKHGGLFKSSLTITKDDLTTSRLQYSAAFFLKPEKTASFHKVGEILSYRIMRSAKSSNTQWRTELLDCKLSKTIDQTLRENIKCMRALYDKKTALTRKQLARHAAELTDTNLIFIGSVRMYVQWQGHGLLQPGMEDYDTLLKQLPVDYAFDGSVVLVPAPMQQFDGNWGPAFRDEDGEIADLKVVQCLIRTYEKCGFEVWVKDQAVGGHAYDVMGKKIAAATGGTGVAATPKRADSLVLSDLGVGDEYEHGGDGED